MKNVKQLDIKELCEHLRNICDCYGDIDTKDISIIREAAERLEFIERRLFSAFGSEYYEYLKWLEEKQK